MAETPPTGVTQTGGRRNRQTGGRGLKGFYKRNKLAVLGGGGALAFLFMSHKGGQATGAPSATAQDQLAQEQAGLAQEQAALESGNLVPGGYDSGLGGGGAGGDTGGAGAGGTLTGDPGTVDGSAGTDPGIGAGPTQLGPVNITVNTAKPHPAAKRTAKANAAAKAKARGAAKSAQHHNQAAKAKAPKPKQAAKGRPAPAHKSGGHKPTPKKTAHGNKKRSPALVESIFGAGAGIVVMGRQFPGAQRHHMGPPRRGPDGEMCRTVTLDYGGRTETHMVHGNGARWTDNLRGMNPPSRGVPMTASRSDSI